MRDSNGSRFLLGYQSLVLPSWRNPESGTGNQEIRHVLRSILIAAPMHPRPTFSLIVPTRSRPAQLRRFLDSAAATARRPERIEVVLVIDEDDPASLSIGHERLAIQRGIVAPGTTLGA